MSNLSGAAMDEQGFCRIVARVEAGEPVADGDLEVLAAQVSREPNNLDLAVCLGHALINSDQPAAALPHFERALELLPDQILILLGRARALAALERYVDAERDLRRVLELHPRHADAMRALALLRLRGGAPGDAERLLGQVLETDPLDEEARQILEEAVVTRAADCGARPPCKPRGEKGSVTVSREVFAERLQVALGGRSLASRIDPARGAMIVRLGPGRDGRLSLENLYEAYASGQRSLDDAVETLVLGLLAMREPKRVPELAAVRDRLFPVIRPREFLAQSGPALATDGPAGLLVLYVIDHPDFVTYLPPDAAQSWGVPLGHVERLALENLDRAPAPLSRYLLVNGGLEEAPAGHFDLLAFDQGDGYDASRLLSVPHRALLEAQDRGPFAVAIPNRAYVLLGREQEERTVRFLAELASAEAALEVRMSSDLFRLAEGRALERWDAGTVARA